MATDRVARLRRLLMAHSRHRFRGQSGHLPCPLMTLSGRSSMALILDETTFGRFVGDCPTEVDFDLDDLSLPNSQDFGVAKPLTGGCPAFIGNEGRSRSLTVFMNSK